MKKYKYLFFDLDGTIIDSCEGVYRSFAYALEHYGIKLDDINILKPILGPPLKDSFVDLFGFDEKKANDAVKKYRERYSVKGLYESKLYDGICETLKILRKKGYVICVATSKPEEFAKTILKYFNADGLFDFIGGATFDGRISNKEDVLKHLMSELKLSDTKDILMIGDRKYDLMGAAYFGIDGLGVLYGYGSSEELEECPHVYLAKDAQDIVTFLEGTNNA